MQNRMIQNFMGTQRMRETIRPQEARRDFGAELTIIIAIVY